MLCAQSFDSLLLRAAFTRSIYYISILTLNRYFFLFVFPRQLREQPHTEWKEDAHGFHEHAAPGTWKRVFHEHVSFETETDRNRHVLESVREAGKDLVSEPQGEAQEGRQGHPEERAQRVQVRERPHRLFQVGGWGISLSGVSWGREGSVPDLRPPESRRLSYSTCSNFYTTLSVPHENWEILKVSLLIKIHPDELWIRVVHCCRKYRDSSTLWSWISCIFIAFGVLTSFPGLNDHPSKCFIGPVTLGEDVC